MIELDMHEIVEAWETYLSSVDDWQALVAGVEPKVGGCGRVYELPNPIDRPNESFAIADMRGMEYSEPHKHQGGETEIYCVIQGTGRVCVGTEVHEVGPGVTIVTRPDTVHCVYSPDQNIVLAVINTPPFNSDNYVSIDETQAEATRRLLVA